MFLYTITLLVILVFIMISWFKKKHAYWANQGVAYEKPTLIIGNFGKVVLLKQSEHIRIKEIYEQFPEEKAVGLYQGYNPCVILRDPEMIKQVLITDFASFQDRSSYIEDGRFNDNLTFVRGKKWKLLRQKLTPVFSSAKIKSMMPLINKGVENLLKYVDDLVDSNTDPEIRSLTAKYTLQVMGKCIFGIEIDAFSGKQNIFNKIAPDIIPETFQDTILQALKNVIPGIMKFFNTKINKPKAHKRSEQFFDTLYDKLLQEREGKPKGRNGFMDFLIELKEQGVIKSGDELNAYELPVDKELITAQLFIFYAGGYETSSLTMAYMIHALAYNNDVQDKAFNEIVTVTNKYNGLITYEAINEMTYLDMIFDETLRMHPVVGTLTRQPSIDYTFPNDKLTIPKGSLTFVSLIGLHHDSKYYPNPEVFDPERFSPENKQKIPTCAYMPFGEGPRNCIGLRFAKIQSLVGMAAFLKRFKVAPSIKSEENLNYRHNTIFLTSKSGVWLKISKR